MPEVATGVHELWDDAWVKTGEWGSDLPWNEVPLVIIATADIKAVGVQLEPVAADVRHCLRDINPGQLFTVPAAELEDLIEKFEG